MSLLSLDRTGADRIGESVLDCGLLVYVYLIGTFYAILGSNGPGFLVTEWLDA